MAKLPGAALNIKMFSDPSPEKYVKLFEFFCEHLLWEQVWSDKYGFVSDFYLSRNNGLAVYSATITKFVLHDDLHKELGNKKEGLSLEVKDGKILVDREVVGLTKSSVTVCLVPAHHLIIFDPRVISPKTICRFFSNLCKIHIVPLRFGHIDVEVITRSDYIDDLIGLPNVQHLQIVLTAPNGDLFSHEHRFFRKYKEQKIHKVEIKFEAPPGTFIQLNRESDEVDLMRMALLDGEITALCVSNDNKLFYFKSSERPFLIETQYNPKEKKYKQALVDVANSIINHLKMKKGRPNGH